MAQVTAPYVGMTAVVAALLAVLAHYAPGV
jgi:hypothetical protein